MDLCRRRQGARLPTQWWWYCEVSFHTTVWGGFSPVGNFSVLTILENANTYIIIVYYITITLVRSFVLVVGSPHHPTTTTTTTTIIAGRVQVPAL